MHCDCASISTGYQPRSCIVVTRQVLESNCVVLFRFTAILVQFSPFDRCERVNQSQNVQVKKNAPTTFVITPLLHIRQKEKIALEIRVKVASVNGHVYTGDFCCDFGCNFLLLNDVKELDTQQSCYEIWYLETFVIDQLLHIVQKEKTALKIAARIAGVNGPLDFRTMVSHKVYRFDHIASDMPHLIVSKYWNTPRACLRV